MQFKQHVNKLVHEYAYGNVKIRSKNVIKLKI